MRQPTIKQQKTLADLQNYYDYSNNSYLTTTMRENIVRFYSFFYDEQWDALSIKELDGMGSTPRVVNRLQPIVSNFIALQIASRRRVGFKATTSLKRHLEASEALQHLISVVQTNNSFQSVTTLKYKDALITGIGAGEMTYDSESSEPFKLAMLNPMELLLDPDDQSKDFSQSNFIGREYYLHYTKAQVMYPDFKEYFDDIGNSSSTQNIDTIYNEQYRDAWTSGKNVKIVEIYYRKNVPYYEVKVLLEKDIEDRENENLDVFVKEEIYKTFDKEIAEALSKGGNKIVEKQGTQIWKGVFTDGILLANNPLEAQVPNQKHFPIIPFCFERNHKGIPYGLVERLIPTQKSENYIWTQVLHNLGSKTLIVERSPTFDVAKDGEMITDKLGQKRATIAVTDAKSAQFVGQQVDLPYWFKGLERVDMTYQQQTMLYEEQRGEATNATSGRAIIARTENSARSQNPYFDAYQSLLFKEGELFLDIVKGAKDLNYTFAYYQSDEVSFGNLSSDIAFLNFVIYPYAAPNFTSNKEEESVRFQELVSSPSFNIVAASKKYLELQEFSPKTSEMIHEEYKRILQGEQEEQVDGQQQTTSTELSR